MNDIENWDVGDIFQNPWHITQVLIERWNKAERGGRYVFEIPKEKIKHQKQIEDYYAQ